jgi:hypothetical protein
MNISDSKTLTNLPQYKFIPRFLSATCPETLGTIHQAVSRRSSILFAFHLCLCLLLFLLLVFPSFVFVLLFFCFSISLGHHQPNFHIRSDGVFLSSSSPDSFVANSPIPDVRRTNASLEPNWRPLFHALNSASQSDPAKVTLQKGRNALLAMNEVLPGTTTRDRFVFKQTLASMRANSESVSNEIDESDVQYEKHDEQRI